MEPSPKTEELRHIGELPIYPSPKPTLTLTSHLGKMLA